MKVFIKGLHGCSMRKVNVRRYRDFVLANGHKVVNNPADSDIVLLWTCAFRKDFRDNSLFEIEHYKEKYKSELVVAGCLPDIDGGLLRKQFSGCVINWRDEEGKLEKVFGSDKTSFSEIASVVVEDKFCTDVEKYKVENPDMDVTFHDQFIKLYTSEGCPYECSYCSERLAFPPFHSFPLNDLVEASRKMVEQTKYYKVMLLGDCLGEYGRDNGSNFPAFIRKLKTIHPDIQFALNNFNLVNFIRYYKCMIEFLQEGYFCHLNLPIQSASSRILKLMKRPYTHKDLHIVFSLLNRIGFSEFDTHLIIGFPGETERDHEETINFILEHRPKYVLISGFLESPRMPACKLPNKVDGETKVRRLKNAEERIKAVGIICNTDHCELSTDRFRKLNFVAAE